MTARSSAPADATPGTDPALRLEAVRKAYDDGTVAVQSLDLEVVRGELLCLVGPSGCGKTTTLKMINRLIEPTSGRIVLDGDDVTRVDAVELRRRTGYVIQQVGLFPHQRIGDNVATVPRLLGWDRRRTRARVDELLDLVGLDPGVYRDRYPAQLSGGQRQRVGVARALAADPPVLLMDEPFSAIDPIARGRLQEEFLRVQEQVRKTVVLVTHDLDEAVRLGDRLAVFRQGGVLEQHDTPARVLGSPASPFVADFVGADRGLRRLSVTGLDGRAAVPVPTVGPGEPAPAGQPYAVVVRDGRPVAQVDDAGRERPLPAAVEVGTSLAHALAALLQDDAGWAPVVEPGTGRLLGVVTPAAVHAALRAEG